MGEHGEDGEDDVGRRDAKAVNIAGGGVRDGGDQCASWVLLRGREKVVSCGAIPNLHGKVDVFASCDIVVAVRACVVATECWVDFIPCQESCRCQIKWIQFLDL